MGKKPMTVARWPYGWPSPGCQVHSRATRRVLKERRPAREVGGRARRKLKALLATGKSRAECAAELGVSTRTIGRAVARMRVASDKSLGAHLSGRVARPAKLRKAAESLDNETAFPCHVLLR